MEKQLEDSLAILKRVTIFAGIDEASLKKLMEECHTVRFAKGEVVIREGTPATNILVILEGTVKVVLSLDKDPLELCVFGPGHCVGETSVIGILDHSASVVAEQDCLLLVLSRTNLMNVFQQDKEFFSLLTLNLARELARRLHRTDQILLDYTRGRRS